MIDYRLQERGRIAEAKFRELLDAQDLNHETTNQMPNTFSKKVRECGGKRADIQALIPDVGWVKFDVKNRKFDPEYRNFTFNEEEIRKLEVLEGISHMPVWLAISNESVFHETWYLVPVAELADEQYWRFNPNTRESFVAISTTECKLVNQSTSISLTCQAYYAAAFRYDGDAA